MQDDPDTGISAASITRWPIAGLPATMWAVAKNGFVGLLFADILKETAPCGGQKGLLRTNPVAFAAPRKNR